MFNPKLYKPQARKRVFGQKIKIKIKKFYYVIMNPEEKDDLTVYARNLK